MTRSTMRGAKSRKEANFFDNLASSIRERCPTIESKQAEALAFAWSRELDEIMTKSLDYATEMVGFRVHEGFKDEMICAVARLSLGMAEKILDAKAAQADLSQLDPEKEVAWAASKEGRAKIENTARMCAEHFWVRHLRHWNEKSDWIARSPGGFPTARRNRVALLQSRRPRTRKNHFIPQFVTERWADDNGKVSLFSRGVGGNLRSQEVGHGAWSFELNLYSEALEEYLGVLESDASKPYQKLCDGHPLDPVDVRSWITFIVVQWLRNPRSLRSISSSARELLKKKGVSYPSQPAQMKMAYETIFTQHRLYEKVYRNLEDRPWIVFSAPAGHSFLLGDSHVSASGAILGRNTMILVPLSPSRCFLAYHSDKKLDWPLRYRTIEAGKEALDEFNSLIADTSSRAISRVDQAESMAPLVSEYLGERVNLPMGDQKLWWGKLVHTSSF